MKNIIIILSLIPILCGCNQKNRYRIYGTMSDNSCDGAQIFLVPAIGPQTKLTVDSVVIKDGKFYFEGNKEQVAILRMEHKHRLNNQELLVITEPGDINVSMGNVGSVTGTKQNDNLQKWKAMHESLINQLPEKWEKWKMSNDSTDFKIYLKLYDSLSNIEIDYTYKFLVEEKGSTLGKYFFNNYSNRFTDREKEELKIIYRK